MKENLAKIKKVFLDLDYDWVEPYRTTEGEINRGISGMHRGLYYIYPEVNFYFGKAATDTVYKRHLTHRAKMDVDLEELYGQPIEKVQPKWIFPQGWKEGVAKYLLEDAVTIPDHYEKIGSKKVRPGVLNFPVRHKVNVEDILVLVWDLEHWQSKDISNVERRIISTIWPYCNNETYRLRRRPI